MVRRIRSSAKRRAKYRFELLIPTAYNDGRPVETYKNQTLLTEFDQEEIYLAVSEVIWLER